MTFAMYGLATGGVGGDDDDDGGGKKKKKKEKMMMMMVVDGRGIWRGRGATTNATSVTTPSSSCEISTTVRMLPRDHRRHDERSSTRGMRAAPS
jgi:hypothetical protein